MTFSWQKTTLVLGLLAAACSLSDKNNDISQLGRAEGSPSSTGPTAPSLPAQSDEPAHPGTVHRGTIKEHVPVTHYSYLRIQTADQDVAWAAVPRGEFKAGQRVSVVEHILMRDFESKTLGRTFKQIVFGTLEEHAPLSDHDTAPSSSDPSTTDSDTV